MYFSQSPFNIKITVWQYISLLTNPPIDQCELGLFAMHAESGLRVRHPHRGIIVCVLGFSLYKITIVSLKTHILWPLKQEHLHYFLVFPHQTIYEEDKTSLSNLHLIVQWCQLPTFTMSESLIQIPSFPNKTLKFPSQTIQWQWQFVFPKSTSQSAFEIVSWLIKTALNICSKSTCTLTHYKAD